jgi:hypothetical protein
MAACSCASCPVFDPVPIPAFDACGGDPVGEWRTTEFINSSLTHTQLRSLIPPIECQVELGALSMPFDMRLDIRDSGTLVLHTSGFAARGRVLLNCLRLSSSVGCDGIDVYSEGICIDTGCGICECPIRFFDDDVTGEWTQMDGTLQLAGSSHKYCVQGDTLELQQSYTNLRYRLSRVAASGSPNR